MTLSQKLIRKWLLPFVLCFSMIFAFFPQSKVDAATYIDGITVDLYGGEGAKSKKLWIDSSHELYYKAWVYTNSNHSVIVTLKDPSGRVVKGPTVVGRNGVVDGWIYWTKTGYYTLTLDCYGSNKDCRARGIISEFDF